jgi:hypothetical protein
MAGSTGTPQRAAEGGALSERGQQKLSEMENSFHQQLTQYKMESLDVAEVKISPDTYQPEVAGVNLTADVSVSASDLIRLHWAYLLDLLEVGAQISGNHPGLVIFRRTATTICRRNCLPGGAAACIWRKKLPDHHHYQS